MRASRKELLAQLPKYEEAMSAIGGGRGSVQREKKFERPETPTLQDEDSEDMNRMKESLEDTMRTIQEMRLMQNVQEEEGG